MTETLSFEALYADVRDAYAELEHALDAHEPFAATAACFDWWDALKRLQDAS